MSAVIVGAAGKFALGDVVRLKSGSDPMTVAAKGQENDTYACVFQASTGQMQSGVFPGCALEASPKFRGEK